MVDDEGVNEGGATVVGYLPPHSPRQQWATEYRDSPRCLRTSSTSTLHASDYLR